ncbi:MAG: excinuclease ABC subunit UvrB [Bacteroidales bacterium]|nr:excinuclease ABC subunit UvrB [Bacteroidales bacterium]
MNFKIVSDYKPSGDQPGAIDGICKALKQGVDAVTLLGVTGSGKTFTMANVIERLQRPALILSHNKTLAAQLYGEFKSFFPNNAVEYFVSYYDYYQPEAYIPTTDTYIEKDLSINDEIEKLRLSAASALMSGRRDVIVISSVSCLYGIGNPEDFHSQTVVVRRGEQRSLTRLLYQLVDALYSRTETDFKRGTFRVRGDTVDVCIGYGDDAVRIEFFGDEVDRITVIDPVSGATIQEIDEISIYPANNFVTTKERSAKAVSMIQDDLKQRYDQLMEYGKGMEAKRLKQRVEYDLEMIKEMGYCPGIENYSRYFDGRKEGMRPFCLMDYFPKDFITFIDESHVTIPQIRAMYGGDHSRKEVLIDYGFRLPAAADNRPLKFDEFEALAGQKVFVSATPAEYELEKSEGLVVEQVVRPTGLLDPPIEVRPTENQVDDLLEEIRVRAEADERVLVTTLTKRMAEELEKYFTNMGVRCRYIHSDVDTMERVEIIEDFKNGLFDVLVGVNLLREGLDIPTVSLVAILDADKEGFLRSGRALTQTAGRAARNVNGLVIMYADTITKSMQETIYETDRRRTKQMEYNKLHGIVPKQVAVKSNALANVYGGEKSGKAVAFGGVGSFGGATGVGGTAVRGQSGGSDGHGRVSAANSYDDPQYIPSPSDLGKGKITVGFGHDAARESNSAFVDGYLQADLAAVLQDPVIRSMSRSQVEKAVETAKANMKKASAELDFQAAARFRDEMWALQQYLKVWRDGDGEA